MKRIFLILFTVVLLTSCASTKSSRQALFAVKGGWTLKDISFPGSDGFVDVVFFGDADARCFKNSDWFFITNNHRGNYQLYKGDCSPGKRMFSWNVIEDKSSPTKFSVTLKSEVEGMNIRKVTTGYRFKLVSINEDQMVWEEKTTFDGEPFTVRMNFIRN